MTTHYPNYTKRYRTKKRKKGLCVTGGCFRKLKTSWYCGFHRKAIAKYTKELFYKKNHRRLERNALRMLRKLSKYRSSDGTWEFKKKEDKSAGKK